MKLDGKPGLALLLAGCVAVCAACDTASQYRAQLADPAPAAPPVTHALSVGTHRVELTLPAKWRHDDRGVAHIFKRSIGTLSLSDLGPVTRDGLHDAVLRARNAFLDGHFDSAREILETVKLDGALGGKHSRNKWQGSWNAIRWAASNHGRDADKVRAAYGDVLSRLFHLPDQGLATVFDEGLRRMGHDDELREVASRQARTVDRRQALLVETWSRRDHALRRYHLLVLNEGYLLVAQTEIGVSSDLKPAFDSLVDSLQLLKKS